MLVPVSLYSNSQADMELRVINCTLLLQHLLKSSLLIGWHTFTCGVPCGVPCGVTSDWLVTWDSHIQTKEMSALLNFVRGTPALEHENQVYNCEQCGYKRVKAKPLRESS